MVIMKATVLLGLLPILQALANNEIPRVPRSNPDTPNVIKISVECKDPPMEDQVSSASEARSARVDPPSDAVDVPQTAQDGDVKMPKLAALLKKISKEKAVPTLQAAKSKLYSLLRKISEDPMTPESSKLSEAKLKLDSLLNKISKDPERVKFPPEKLKLPAIARKEIEDQVLPKSSKLSEAKLKLDSLLRKNSEDRMVPASTIFSPAKLELPSLLRKNTEDQVSANSNYSPSRLSLLSPNKIAHQLNVVDVLPVGPGTLAGPIVEFPIKISKGFNPKKSLLKRPVQEVQNPTLAEAPYVDPIKYSRSQLPKIGSLVRKSTEPERPAAPGLKTLDEVLKNTNLQLPKVLASLNKDLSDPMSSVSSNLRAAEEAVNPAKSKLRQLKIPTLLGKKSEDPIAIPDLKDNTEPLLIPKLPNILSRLNKKTDDGDASASSQVNAIANPPPRFDVNSLSQPLKIEKLNLPKLQDLLKNNKDKARARLPVNELIAAPTNEVAKTENLPRVSKLREFIDKKRKELLTPVSLPVDDFAEAPKKELIKIESVPKLSKLNKFLNKKKEESIPANSLRINKFAEAPKIEPLAIERLPKLSKLREFLDSIREKQDASASSKVERIASLPRSPAAYDIPEAENQIAEIVEPAPESAISLGRPKLNIKNMVDKVRALILKPVGPLIGTVVDVAGTLPDATGMTIGNTPQGTSNVVLEDQFPVAYENIERNAVSPLNALPEKSNLNTLENSENNKKTPLQTLLERSSVSKADVEKKPKISLKSLFENLKDSEPAASKVSDTLEPNKTDEFSKLKLLLKKPKVNKALLDKARLLKPTMARKFNPPKIDLPTARTPEEVSSLLVKIKSTLEQAVENGKMDAKKGRSLLSKLSVNKDMEEGASNAAAVQTEPESVPTDLESFASNAESSAHSAPDDDTIELSQSELNIKSCELCKCIMKAFPEKFGKGKFRAANEENVAIFPKLKKPILNPKISERIRDALNLGDDPVVGASDQSPSFLPPPEEFDEHAEQKMEIERAERIQEGIKRLIKFVELVGELDQYVSHKTRNFITKMARLYDGEDNPQLL